MKYPHGFAIQIPYVDTMEDGSTTYNYALVSSNSSVDRRRVKRVIRQWVAMHLGRRIGPVEHRLLMRMVKRHTEPMQYFVQRQTNAAPDA